MSKRTNEQEEKKTDTTEQKGTSSSQQTGADSGTNMPSYLEAALRITATRPLGANRTDNRIVGEQLKFVTGNDVGLAPVSGICVLDYVPTLGRSDSATSALNRAMYVEFNAIRSKISGNRPYEPADHMIYRLCVSGLREMYHYVRRIYGIVRKYSVTNLYRPREILRAMGLDPDSWINNAADLYQWLLTHKASLAPFPTVPLGTVTSRHEAYNTYLFTDGEPECAQTYILNQEYYYSYENVDEVKGATLVSMPDTYSNFLTQWDAMYTALQNSSDVYIIAADIRRAFEDRVITDLPDTPVDYEVAYEKLDAVLTSIMNATICPTRSAEKFKVYDGLSDGLLCKPDDLNPRDENLHSGFFGHINMVEANPDARSLSYAVRLKPAVANIRYEDAADGSYFDQYYDLVAFGTEVVTGARILGRQSNGAPAINTFSTVMVAENWTGDADSSRNDDGRGLTLASELSTFDWHPPVAMLTMVNAADSNPDSHNNVVGFYPIEDVQNYIPITVDQLKQIFDAIILAEFGF